MSAKVTMIIPVYNGASYIEDCLASVLDQTYKNLDCLLINDGSTDVSAALLDRLAAAHPERLRVIHQANAGVAATRNRGITLADGDYLMFADNDDFLEPEYVARMVQELESAGADMVVSGFHRTGEDGRIQYTHRLTQDPWSKYRAVAPWGRIMRRDFVLKNELAFGEYRVGEDSYFSVSAYHAPGRIVTTDYVGYHWINRPASVSNTVQKRSDIASALPVLEGLLARVPRAEDQSQVLFDYFIIKFIAWHLTFITKDTAWPTLSCTCDQYYAWLGEHLPDYRKNPEVSPFRPAGELFGIRLTVWLMTKSPLWFKKLLLRIYSAIAR